MKRRGSSNGKGPSAESRAVLDAVRRLERMIRLSGQAAEKRAGLSPAQLYVLHKLADSPPLTLGELSRRTLTNQSSVSEVVQKLVSRRLVRSVRSAEDRRSVQLSLTDAGRSTLRKAPAAVQDHIVEGLEKMPLGDRRELARLLTRLVGSTP